MSRKTGWQGRAAPGLNTRKGPWNLYYRVNLPDALVFLDSRAPSLLIKELFGGAGPS